MTTAKWTVWRSYYMTYAEVAAYAAATGIPQDKCCRPELVASGLTLEGAKRMADELGFGYCAKPATP